MTREEIEKAFASDGAATVWANGDKAIIDFAVDMVRKGYEELRDQFEGYNQTYFGIGELLEIIRRAKP